MRRRVWGSDAKAVAVLVGVPLIVFVLPALAGHPAIAGDNVIQNFPLRVFSGDLLRHGQLPMWNKYIWSGSPLLGGMNSGSFYPGTLVFAVMPAVAAWVINLLAAYWAGGLGLYALTRQLGVSPLAALLAAATYGFGGAMTAQMVHLPIVQGWAWVPLIVLAQYRLTWRVLGVGPGDVATRTSPWPWVSLLAASLGLVLLTGEPRGMAEAEVVATLMTLWLVFRRYPGQMVAWRRRLMLVAYMAVAGIWGAALGAAQLLPGWSFITASQRASEPFSYFGSGSLHPQWSVLLLVPDLFGGDGILHQPAWFASYNLAEVTGYVGLMPLAAFFGLLTRSFGKRRDPKASEWSIWFGLVALGLLMAFGEFTPLGGVFGDIPFFNDLRLQSRNLGIVDLALAVLFAYWVDRFLQERKVNQRINWRGWVTAVPVLIAFCLCVTFMVVPGRVESALGASPSPANLNDLRPWIGAQIAVVLAGAVVVLGRRRPSERTRRQVFCAVVAVDLLLFTVSSSTGFVAGNFTIHPDAATAASVLGTKGRFAIYNPTNSQLGILTTVGQTDLNAFTQLSSVQGYGSLTYSAYQAPTGVRTLDSMNPCALAKGVFAPLRLATLLTLPTFLAPQLESNSSPGNNSSPVSQSSPACSGAPAPGTAGARSFYFGQLLSLSSVTLIDRPTSESGTGPPRVGIIGATGAMSWPAETVTGSRGDRWTVRLASEAQAVGIEVRGPARAVTDASVVTAVGGAQYVLDGQLQNALGEIGWRFSGLWNGYARFERTHLRPPVWLAEKSPGASVHQVSAGQDGGEVDRAHLLRTSLIVRSEAYQAGWRAVAVPARGGPARNLTVVASGLVQAVRVPAGTWLITFSYWAPGLTPGLAVTGLGVAGLLLYGVVSGTRRRNRGRPAKHNGAD